MYPAPRLRPLGDAALLVEFAADISDAALAHVQAALVALAAIPNLELVPAYTSILILYPPTISYPSLRRRIRAALRNLDPAAMPPREVIIIPTAYGGEAGPDLAAVAAMHRFSEEEVIRLHTSLVYTVYMLGFAPGFAYLGSLPPELDTPRRPTPRLHVAPGSVGLAGRQTGIYALDTPGGWQIIGRTALTLWEAERDPPSLLRPGDRVRFVVI